MMIKKAVILAAGLGQRFLPITRIIPKPMLPIGNKPTLDYIIHELIESGIEQILIVVGHRKEIIEEYYRGRVEIQFVVQNTLNGTAPAVLLAEEFVNQEAFALCLSDEVVESIVPCIKQLIDVFNKYSASMVTAIEETTDEKIHTYNAVAMGETQGKVSKLISIIEKPQNAYPSLFTSIGRYVIAPEIFNLIRSLKVEEAKELYLTEAFNLLLKENNAYGLRFEGKRWDIGTKEGWIETNVRLGMDKSIIHGNNSNILR
jgi:UTP--glucose-1-phosphate uridylyltransferase